MSTDRFEKQPWEEELGGPSTILVVDDSEFFADMMANEIENRSSFDAIGCYGGKAALDELERNEIACIVSDYQMEPIDGIELLETVQDDFESVPLILLTGKGGEDVAIKAIRLGATDYVTKETIIEEGEFSLLLNRIEQSVAHTRAQTELTRQNELIEEQRDDLELLNEVLRHDIRNDLQIISTYADLLEDHVDESGTEYLGTIEQSADNAIELTQTTGRIAEIMLKHDITRQETAIRAIITEEIAAIRETNPEATVKLADDIPDTPVLADQMVDAILRNLLKNAIQHNDKHNPEIVVSAVEQDDTLEVRVADNGPGISEAETETIFSKGEKGLESDGTGMGLYLVTMLVDNYGGDVWVEDNDPEGSVFVVGLPLASDESP